MAKTKNHKGLIGSILFFIFLAVGIVVLISFTDVGFLSNVKGPDNVFDGYQMKYDMGDNGKYMLTFEDVITSAADMPDKVYIRADVIIQTASKETANKVRSRADHSVAVIARDMSGMRAEELRTPQGKEYLKRKIKEEMTQLYKVDDIEEVYLSNFVFK